MRLTSRGGAWLALAGLVVVLVGTFLPWLRSGSVLRDSYQSLDVLRARGGAAGALLYSWLAVAPLCSISIALYALAVRGIAAVLACLVAVLVAVTSSVAMAHIGSAADAVGFSPVGPVVTLLGAVGAFVGGIVILRGLRRPRAGVGQSGVRP